MVVPGQKTARKLTDIMFFIKSLLISNVKREKEQKSPSSNSFTP
jgi:hypothetical protein